MNRLGKGRLWRPLLGIVLALALALGSTGGVAQAEQGATAATRKLTLTKLVPRLAAELIPDEGFEILVNGIGHEFRPTDPVPSFPSFLYEQRELDIAVGEDTVLKEETVPNGWSLSAATCSVAPSGRGVVIAQLNPNTKELVIPAGDGDIWCSFLNVTETRPVHITKKISAADAHLTPTGKFVFMVNGAPYEVVPDQVDEDDMVVGETTVWISTDDEVSISEQLDEGWSFQSSSCKVGGIGRLSGPPTVANLQEYSFDKGDTSIACEFVNRRPPSIIIEKLVDGESGEQFEFWIDVYPPQNGDDNGGEPQSSELLTKLRHGEGHWVAPKLVFLNDQTVVIREKLPTADWEASVSCTGSFGGVVTGDDFVAFTNVTSLNAHIICTFTNTPPPPPEPWTPPPPPPVTNPDPTPVPDPDPQPAPDPAPEPEPTPILPTPPAAPPDLPRTGGTYAWHILAGTSLLGMGTWLRRRRR